MRYAIDGFLMQKANFQSNILIRVCMLIKKLTISAGVNSGGLFLKLSG